jgi:hypothetical protein
MPWHITVSAFYTVVIVVVLLIVVLVVCLEIIITSSLGACLFILCAGYFCYAGANLNILLYLNPCPRLLGDCACALP